MILRQISSTKMKMVMSMVTHMVMATVLVAVVVVVVVIFDSYNPDHSLLVAIDNNGEDGGDDIHRFALMSPLPVAVVVNYVGQLSRAK